MNKYLFVFVVFLVISVIGLFNATFRYFAEQSSGTPISFQTALLIKLPVWYFASLTLPLVLYEAQRFLKLKKGSVSKYIRPLIIFAVLTLAIILIGTIRAPRRLLFTRKAEVMATCGGTMILAVNPVFSPMK